MNQIPNVNYPSREIISRQTTQECGEPMVEIITSEKLFLREGSKFLVSKLRKTVYEKLIAAANSLPHGYSFKVMSAYIPVSLQQNVWNDKTEKIKKKYKMIWWIFPPQVKNKLIRKYAAYPVKGAPHNTGGAVDVVLCDESGNELPIGGIFAAADETAHTRYEKITEEERKNREMIYWAMIDQGFVNQPFEWWHYSYGDKTWATLTNQDAAIYGSAEDLV